MIGIDQARVTKLNSFGVLIEALDANHSLSEIAINDLRAQFEQEQLVVMRGFRAPETSEDFVHECERWGVISVWPFGKVLELKEHEKPVDHIFDNNYVPLHWDGMYRQQVPEYQIFHCVEAPLPGQGGRTTFSNTKLVLENMSEKSKRVWSQITGTYKRKMEFYDSTTRSAIMTKHPRRGFPVIRYNEPPTPERGIFLNPPDLEFKGISRESAPAFHREIQEALYSAKNFYAHEWQKGDVVIADNFTLLHGREEFISRAPRHLRRVHVLSEIPFDNPGLESFA